MELSLPSIPALGFWMSPVAPEISARGAGGKRKSREGG